MLMKAHKQKNLYILEGSIILGEANATRSLENESRLWHARFDQMSEKGMNILHKQIYYLA